MRDAVSLEHLILVLVMATLLLVSEDIEVEQGGPDPEPPGQRKRLHAPPPTALEADWQLVFRPFS